MKWRSLRSRIVVSAVLWALALTGASHYFVMNASRMARAHVHISHYALLTLAGIIIVATGLVQLRWSLAPFAELRRRLAAVRQGASRRVEGSYPTEFDPLIDDLNGLLDHRERLVDQALQKSGDLAHALKTPLTLLQHEADAAEARGLPEVAQGIRVQVALMQKQIDYRLFQARAAVSSATPGLQCAVRTSAEGLARTLRRLHAGREIEIAIDCPEPHAVKGRPEDLDEMLGNLMDNACKWATSQVRVRSIEAGGMIAIRIDDDGPGLDPAMREQVMRRGVRADEAAPGSGLGLAIVQELVVSYGGRVELTAPESGIGLRAVLTLPAACLQ